MGASGAAGVIAGGICHRRQVRGHVPGATRQVVELIGSPPPQPVLQFALFHKAKHEMHRKALVSHHWDAAS